MFRQVICCCQLRVTHFRYICTIIPKHNTMNTWIRFFRVNTLNWATCQKGLIIVLRTRDHLWTSCCWSLLQKSSIEHSRWAYASLSWCCYYKIVLNTKPPYIQSFYRGWTNDPISLKNQWRICRHVRKSKLELLVSY